MATVINSSINPVPIKEHSPRGSSFTPVEDEAIAKAWVVASKDQIVGTEQKGNEFFSKIKKVYNEKIKPANRGDRSMVSVKTKCKAIHKECTTFSGCHARITRAGPTGVSTNSINMETAIYNRVEIENVEDDCWKLFKYLPAWKILQCHHKFIVAGKKPKPSKMVKKNEEKGSIDPSEQSDVTPSAKVNVCYSPLRSAQRAAKGPKNKKLKKEGRRKSCVLQHSAAQQERNETLRRHYEIMLSTNAPGALVDSMIS